MSLENVTGDSSQDRWRYIRNLLLMDLEQSKFLRLVPPEKLLQQLKDLDAGDTGVYAQDVLDRIASRESVDFYILGSFMATGEGCLIDVRIVDARSRESVGSRSFNAAGLDDIQDRCDEISFWAKQHFGLSRKDLKKDVDQELRNYTTESIDALICFVRGLDFYDQGDMKQSVEFYLKALAIDKDFALAHAKLAINFTYEGRYEEAEEHILKAMSLRKNLSARERLLIEGDYYNLYEPDYPEAIDRFETLLKAYPNDEMALELQGAIYRNIEDWENAARCFNRLQALDPTSRITVDNLAFIAEATGQYERAAGILRDNAAVFDAPDELHEKLAFCLFSQGDIDQAWSEVQKALSLNPERAGSIRAAGQILTARGDFPPAEAAYRRLLEGGQNDVDKSEGHYWLGYLYVLQGKHESASREIEAGLKLARSRQGFLWEEANFLIFKSYLQRLRGDFSGAFDAASRARQKSAEMRYKEYEIKALHLMGLCQVSLGHLAAAQKTGLEMDQIIRKIGYPKLLRLGHHLEGTIAGARNSWDEAAVHFSRAVESLPQQHFMSDPHGFFLESLASALLRRGDPDSSRAQYEKVISLTTGILTSGDAYSRSLFELGRICQDKNEPEKAKEYFQRFLRVLQDSDAGLPEVQDARRRLASLS
jgi:tetratricopeptide (TPR) repeat protein